MQERKPKLALDKSDIVSLYDVKKFLLPLSLAVHASNTCSSGKKIL